MHCRGTPSLLFVDNDEDTRSMVTVLLELSGINVTTAATITEARHLAQTLDFDLYLLATRFPDGCGLDLCRLLRSRAPNTPIIFYSGDAYQADLREGLAAGADAYLVKPYKEDLAETVLVVLNRPPPLVSRNRDNALSGQKKDDAHALH